MSIGKSFFVGVFVWALAPLCVWFAVFCFDVWFVVICLHTWTVWVLVQISFLTAYAHVRTEPQCDIGHTRGKKSHESSNCGWYPSEMCQAIQLSFHLCVPFQAADFGPCIGSSRCPNQTIGRTAGQLRGWRRPSLRTRLSRPFRSVPALERDRPYQRKKKSICS